MSLRNFIESEKEDSSISDVLLSDHEWERVKNVTSILESFNKYTKCLQSTRTTLSDFYGFWLKIKLKLQASSSLDPFFVEIIQKEMESREVLLFDNPTMLGALYLDPRYQCVLTENQKEIAVNHLVTLFQKITSLEAKPDMVNGCTDDTNMNTSDDEVEEYLRNIRGNASNDPPVPNIESMVKSFDGSNEDNSIKILDYWQSKGLLLPELFKLASHVSNFCSASDTDVSRESVFIVRYYIYLTSHKPGKRYFTKHFARTFKQIQLNFYIEMFFGIVGNIFIKTTFMFPFIQTKEFNMFKKIFWQQCISIKEYFFTETSIKKNSFMSKQVILI